MEKLKMSIDHLYPQDSEEAADKLLSELRSLNKPYTEGLESMVREYKRENQFLRKKLEFYSHLNSHQMRAPLVQMMGLIDLLSESSISKKEALLMDYLKAAAENMDEMIRCINRVLEADDNESSDSY
jgi:signal transduction histidine kinase